VFGIGVSFLLKEILTAQEIWVLAVLLIHSLGFEACESELVKSTHAK
jgi:hypothetical protein